MNDPESGIRYDDMNIFRPALFLALLMLLSSCNKDENFLFELEYEASIEIPAGLNPIETHFSRSAELFTNLNNQLAARGLQLSDIRAIQPVEVSLRPNVGILDYRIFTEMNAFLIPIDDPNDRLELGFALDPRLFDNSIVQLIPGIADVTDYLNAGVIYLQLRFRIQEIPLGRTQHILRVRFRVTGK